MTGTWQAGRCANGTAARAHCGKGGQSDRAITQGLASEAMPRRHRGDSHSRYLVLDSHCDCADDGARSATGVDLAGDQAQEVNMRWDSSSGAGLKLKLTGC